MSVVLIPQGEDFIVEIVRLVDGRNRDCSADMVVFPGKRPAHFLRKALAAEIGGSFIPPAIVSMDGFVDIVYESIQPGRKLDTIDAVAILFEIHKKAKDRLGGNGFMTLDAFFPLGVKIYHDIEELFIEDIGYRSVKEIQPFAEEAIPPETLQRIQTLSFFYEEFYTTVGSHNFATRSYRYRMAAEKVEEFRIGKFRRVIFAGFHALTRSEKTLFRKMRSFGKSIFIFQDGPGMRENLRDLGMEAECRESPLHEPEIRIYSSPDAHGQVYAVGKIIKELNELNKVLDEKTVVVLPSSDTLFPLVRQGLAALQEKDYNISLGYPLHRTAIYGFLNNLMELITSMDEDRIYIPDYLKFVLHPYTKNICFEGSAETTRIILHVLEEVLTRYRTRTFLPLAAVEEDEGFIQNAAERLSRSGKAVSPSDIRRHVKEIHRNTIGKFLSFENVRDFALKCSEVLQYIFMNSTARLHALFLPFSESFMRSLDAISGSLMKDMVFAESAGYFTFLRKYLVTCHTPFDGTPLKGLQVLGLLETRNLKFERVFVLDANEDTVPNTTREDSLLPLKARQILGLPTYMDRDRLISYYFGNLIRGAKEVHLFYLEDDARERSRFIEELLWEEQRRNAAVTSDDAVAHIQYRVSLENGEPESIVKTAAVVSYLKEFAYSATAIDTYLRCPLRFYYSHVLRLEKRKEMSGDIERADIGKLFHGAISAYFSKRKGIPLRAKDVSIDEMDREVERLFRREYGENVAGAVFLLKRQIRNHLRELLKNYYVPLIGRRSVTIVDNERVIKNLRLGTFNVQGRIDGLERRDGKTCIIDYKTSSNADRLRIDFKKLKPDERETWSDTIGSLQLPFYLMLYAGETHASMGDLDAMFLLLGRTRITSEIELPLFGDTVRETAYEMLENIVLNLLEEIVNPQIPFIPTNDKRRTCPHCDFQYLCGTQWVIA